jgi:lipopolysaccharide export system permease protein
MRILDNQRYWAFMKAYFTCYLSLVGLWIVIDAFSNLDEFMKRAEGFAELMNVMSRYYLVRQALYYDYLGGVIGMMAAIFTVTWMQRNNEHLAILAAGISTHRAIRPVLASSVLVSGLSVFNQEYIIPRYAEELQKSHDDDGMSKVMSLPKRYDSRRIMIHGKDADRATRTITARFNVTIPFQIFGSIREIEGRQATYIPPEHPGAPLTGGWLIRGATLNLPIEKELLKPGASILTQVTDTKGFPPPFGGNQAITAGETYFLKSNLSFKSMLRKSNWYQYASMGELFDGLVDSASDKTELNEITMHIHVRLIRPILALTLLFMSLPLVLGGFGRNMFINLGFALGNSALFYGMGIVCTYLGSSAVLAPSLAAWVPLFLFALVARLRWDQIRT